ncbi:MAG: tRNA (adenosine(37)-N6)-dimethylallyltransferase MiaA, partial [Mucilaginibacter polytrichastri]|nr:tRNA (adenosine(37)-N6)-dimethylallyltransferase MiaA [Mucilaginibacter polytrichastri]
YIEALLRDFNYTQVPVDEDLRADLNQFDHEKLAAMFRSIESPYRDKADLSTKKRTIRAIEISRWLEENALSDEPEILPHVIFGLNPPVQERWTRISERLETRLQQGLVDEVKNLLQNKLGHEDLNYYGLEYKFVGWYLRGELSYEQMVFQLSIAIRQFAKRQMTFFRKMEKDGLHIHWLDLSQDSTDQILNFLGRL